MKWLKLNLFTVLIFGCSGNTEQIVNANLIDHVAQQLEYAVKISESLRDSLLTSPRTIVNGKLKMVPGRDWTSGFFPGNLWMMEELTGDEKWQKQLYITVADKMLATLSSKPFLAPVGENKGFLLLHSTGSKPNNSEIDVPIVYADYYFLESLLRKQHIGI